MNPRILRAAAAPLVLLALVSAAAAQGTASEGKIETIPVADGIFMLVGQGGNLGLFVGDDGGFLIDDQYAPLSEKIRAAIAAVTDRPVRFVVNTHWHGDHTGGNENFGKAGAILVAHENVRARMSTEQFLEAFGRTVPASPEAALPGVTFTDAVTFHWNGDEVRVFHVDPAHTDGDAVVHFRRADVLHAGDLFFNGLYPFIDVSSGGSLAGMIAAVDRILALVGPDTKIIPGHGPLGGVEDLRAYRAMLAAVHAKVRAWVDDGKTADEVVAARPTGEFDEAWGNGFLKPNDWVRIVYASVASEKK